MDGLRLTLYTPKFASMKLLFHSILPLTKYVELRMPIAWHSLRNWINLAYITIYVCRITVFLIQFTCCRYCIVVHVSWYHPSLRFPPPSFLCVPCRRKLEVCVCVCSSLNPTWFVDSITCMHTIQFIRQLLSIRLAYRTGMICLVRWKSFYTTHSHMPNVCHTNSAKYPIIPFHLHTISQLLVSSWLHLLSKDIDYSTESHTQTHTEQHKRA